MLPGDMSKSILTGLKTAAAPNMVLGEPIAVQGTTLVPVISITTAYGGSANHTGGGGFKIDPVAVVALRDGEINVYPLQRGNAVEKLAALLPKVLELDNDEE
ncbi:GerW family sporulation protein [Desulfoscipio geothermicus]|uniref:GerW family sporulation protein n=1 Tax=Desulfoscipio geothermicus TaxID=39060 RepID=UPI000B85A033|nr:spore germination protein GerW family protein [Desulfoscipio geothermicus]